MGTLPGTGARLTMAPDEELMGLVAGGDVNAFEELYDRFAGRAYGVARAVCREPAVAEEAVQDAFVAIWRSADTYARPRGTVTAWLLTMVRYRAVDAARRNGTHTNRQSSDATLETRPALTPGPADLTVRSSEAEHLHHLLGRIPHAQREVIALAYFGQLTHTQIAAQLDLPAGTVKGRMRLGMDKLRLALEGPVAPAA